MLTRTENKPVAATPSQSGSIITVFNAALEERYNGDIILRGSIAPDSLRNLKTDDYQREVLAASGGKKSKLRKGVEQGVTLPDIELGMRGSNVSFTGKKATLHDPVYIIDGLQRVSAMLSHMADLAGKDGKEVSNTNPLGATIHFSTTKEWEKQRFSDLNQLRTPVSPNVLLRNQRDAHPGVLTLYGLTYNEPGFALYRRICWTQRMGKGELISAMSMLRTALSLHRSIADAMLTGAGSKGNERILGRGDRSMTSNAGTLDRIAKEIGLSNFRENTRDFFEIIDGCFGLRNVEYGQLQAHLRGNFLITVAGLISRNPSLWDEKGRRFFLDAKTRQRLASFPVYDPEIRRLCSAGTMVLPTLYNHLLMHMNKGKSKHKLR